MHWREIPGFTNYEVSEYGDVRRHIAKPRGSGPSLEPGALLKPAMDKGYHCYCLTSIRGYRAKVSAAKCVALAFCGEPPTEKHWALHKDDNRKNDHHSNIYWGTAQDNADDRGRNNHIPYKLTRADAELLRRMVDDKNMTKVEIAKYFGIRYETIYSIYKNKKYGGQG